MNRSREKQQLRKNLKKRRNNKIQINSPNDLINIPLQQLREEDVSKFYGAIFDKIYKEALKIERKKKEENITQYSDSSEDSYKKYEISKKTKSKKFNNYEEPTQENRKTGNKNIQNDYKKDITHKKNTFMKMNTDDDYFKNTYRKKKEKFDEEEEKKEDENGSFVIVEESSKYTKKNKNNQKFKELIDLKKSKYMTIDYNENKYNNTNFNDINDNRLNIKNKNKSRNKDNKNKFITSPLYFNLDNSLEFNSFDIFNTINSNRDNHPNFHLNQPEIIDKKKNSQNITLKKITFQIKHLTKYGEEVGISGSIPSLGDWNIKKILYLRWTNGNEWIGSVNIYEINDFEFKLVVLRKGKVKNWELGSNNKINVNELLKEVKYRSNGKYGKFNYEFNINTNELKLLYNWC